MVRGEWNGKEFRERGREGRSVTGKNIKNIKYVMDNSMLFKFMKDFQSGYSQCRRIVGRLYKYI